MTHHYHPVTIFDACIMMTRRQEIMSRIKLCICIEVYLKIQASIIQERDLIICHCGGVRVSDY